MSSDWLIPKVVEARVAVQVDPDAVPKPVLYLPFWAAPPLRPEDVV